MVQFIVVVVVVYIAEGLAIGGLAIAYAMLNADCQTCRARQRSDREHTTRPKPVETPRDDGMSHGKIGTI